MTRDYIDGDITIEADFEAALGQLLLAAIRNDIDTGGSWVYRNGKPAPDLEVMVYELEDSDVAQ
jgi:hypothetical protein